MMSLQARLISIVAGLALLLIVSVLVRRRRIYNIYAITWLAFSGLLLALGIFHRAVTVIASTLGIAMEGFAIFTLAIGCMVFVMLHLSIIVSGQHQEIKRLEKELALLAPKKPS